MGSPRPVWAPDMGPTKLRVTVGQAEETDCWWERYKHTIVFSAWVLLLILQKGKLKLRYFDFHHNWVLN